MVTIFLSGTDVTWEKLWAYCPNIYIYCAHKSLVWILVQSNKLYQIITFLEPTNLHFEFAFVKIPASNTIALLLFLYTMGPKHFLTLQSNLLCTKVKCIYGVPKFKPICQEKFHICSCFVIVFSLNVKKIPMTWFEFGYTVTELYFTIRNFTLHFLNFDSLVEWKF